MLGSDWIDNPDLLKLDQNERSEAPPGWAEAAMRELTPFAICRYPQRQRLEQRLSAFHGLGTGSVLVTNGSDEAIQILFQGLPTKSTLVIPLPTFGIYLDQADRYDLDQVRVAPATRLALDVNATISAIERHRADLLVLVRPNNPTGELIDESELDRLLRACHSQGTRFLLDEAYADFANCSAADLLATNPHLMILRTFSKAYGLAGFRVGYLMAQPSIIGTMRQRAMPYNVTTPSLLMAERALRPDAVSEVNDYCRRIDRNRGLVESMLHDWGIPFCDGKANFLLLELGCARAQFARNALAQLGINVRRFDREELLDYLRVSIPLNVERLIEGLQRVLRPDLICLDVDGCLVDVGMSFESTIIEAVARLTGRQIDRSAIVAMRRRGGFNDDWRLTSALVQEFGGTSDHDRVRETCESLYWGRNGDVGFQSAEKPLVDSDRLRHWRTISPVALVTGRSRAELKPVLPILGLEPEIPAATIDSVGRGKPDPEGILQMLELTGTRRPWMVGDNVDDMRAGVAAGAVAIGVGTDMVDALYEAGAATVLEHISLLEDLL